MTHNIGLIYSQAHLQSSSSTAESYAMMNYLSNFVKRGDPNKPKSPNENTYGLTVKNFYLNLEWERYTLDNKKRIVFSLDGKQGPNYKSPSQVNYRLGSMSSYS